MRWQAAGQLGGRCLLEPADTEADWQLRRRRVVSPANPRTRDLVPDLHTHDQLVGVGLCQPHRQPAKAAADVGKLDPRRRAALGGRGCVQLRVVGCPAGGNGTGKKLNNCAVHKVQGEKRQRRLGAPVELVWVEGHGEGDVVERVAVRPHAIHLLFGELHDRRRLLGGGRQGMRW